MKFCKNCKWYASFAECQKPSNTVVVPAQPAIYNVVTGVLLREAVEKHTEPLYITCRTHRDSPSWGILRCGKQGHWYAPKDTIGSSTGSESV